MSFIALTPNLALDRTLQLNEALQVGELHRVYSLREVAGGKGVNVARVLKTLGAQVSVAGFLGGFNGQKFRKLLKDEGLEGIFHEVEGETRECQILVDSHAHPTEVYERGPTVSFADWQCLLERLSKGKMIISGSLATGISATQFTEILSALPHKPYVDASGDMLKAALEAKVALVKPNRAELASIVTIKGNGIVEAQTLYEEFGVPILLSLGATGVAYVAEQVLRVDAPSIDLVNPVASGDSLLAAFVWAQDQGWPLQDALRLAVAAGTENAASGGGARFSKAALMKRLEHV